MARKNRRERIADVVARLEKYERLRHNLYHQIENRMVFVGDQEAFDVTAAALIGELRTLADSLEMECDAMANALFVADQAGLMYLEAKRVDNDGMDNS